MVVLQGHLLSLLGPRGLCLEARPLTVVVSFFASAQVWGV